MTEKKGATCTGWGPTPEIEAKTLARQLDMYKLMGAISDRLRGHSELVAIAMSDPNSEEAVTEHVRKCLDGYIGEDLISRVRARFSSENVVEVRLTLPVYQDLIVVDIGFTESGLATSAKDEGA